jgi:hypothetical protein
MEVFKIEDFCGEIYLVPKEKSDHSDLYKKIDMEKRRVVFLSPSKKYDWFLQVADTADVFFPDALRCAAIFLQRVRALPFGEYEIETQKGRSVLDLRKESTEFGVGVDIGRCKALASRAEISVYGESMSLSEILTPLGIYRVMLCDDVGRFDMGAVGSMLCERSVRGVPRGAVALSFADNGLSVSGYLSGVGVISDTCAYAAALCAARSFGLRVGKEVMIKSEKSHCICSSQDGESTYIYSVAPTVSKIYFD